MMGDKKKKTLAITKFVDKDQEIHYLEHALIPYLKRLLAEAKERLRHLAGL